MLGHSRLPQTVAGAVPGAPSRPIFSDGHAGEERLDLAMPSIPARRRPSPRPAYLDARRLGQVGDDPPTRTPLASRQVRPPRPLHAALEVDQAAVLLGPRGAGQQQRGPFGGGVDERSDVDQVLQLRAGRLVDRRRYRRDRADRRRRSACPVAPPAAASSDRLLSSPFAENPARAPEGVGSLVGADQQVVVLAAMRAGARRSGTGRRPRTAWSRRRSTRRPSAARRSRRRDPPRRPLSGAAAARETASSHSSSVPTSGPGPWPDAAPASRRWWDRRPSSQIQWSLTCSLERGTRRLIRSSNWPRVVISSCWLARRRPSRCNRARRPAQIDGVFLRYQTRFWKRNSLSVKRAHRAEVDDVAGVGVVQALAGLDADDVVAAALEERQLAGPVTSSQNRVQRLHWMQRSWSSITCGRCRPPCSAAVWDLRAG